MPKLLMGYNQFLCAESVLDGQWSLSLFEDLNRLIEGVVLYDEIVLLGAYNVASSDVYRTLSREGVLKELPADAVQQLVAVPATAERFRRSLVHAYGISDGDAFNISPHVVLGSRIPPMFSDQLAYESLANVVSRQRTNDGYNVAGLRDWLRANIVEGPENVASFNYFSRGLLYSAIADTSSFDYAPDFLRLPIAAVAFTAGHKPVTKALYDALSAKLESEVEALTALGMPAALFLPPLTTAVLQTGARRGNVMGEVLKLRRRFEPYRQTYREFEAILQDSTRTLREKIAARNRLFNEIIGVLNAAPGEHALHIKTIWDKVISSSLDERGIGSKLSLSGMVSVLIDQLVVERTKGRARALFDLWTDALNVKDYGLLVQQAFGAKISASDVELMKAYSLAVRAIIRMSAPTGSYAGSG
jgi:hypothetical protein